MHRKKIILVRVRMTNPVASHFERFDESRFRRKRSLAKAYRYLSSAGPSALISKVWTCTMIVVSMHSCHYTKAASGHQRESVAAAFGPEDETYVIRASCHLLPVTNAMRAIVPCQFSPIQSIRPHSLKRQRSVQALYSLSEALLSFYQESQLQ